MAKLNNYSRKATPRAAIAALSLPSPNPLPPGVMPYRQSPTLPTQPIPATLSQPSSDSFSSNEQYDQQTGHIVEVLDSDDEKTTSKPAVSMEPPALNMSAPTQPTSARSPKPEGKVSITWASLATTAVMFDDAPCPSLDPSKKYWVSYNGTHAGVFDDGVLFAAEGTTGFGPKSLSDAFELWKHGCISGAVRPTKPISPHSVFPRIVQKSPPKRSVKATAEARARRDQAITDLFIAGMKEAADAMVEEAHAAPSEEHSPLVDSVGNIFQTGMTSSPASDAAAPSFLGPTAAANTKLTVAQSKPVSKTGGIPSRSHSRSPSFSSSGFSEASVVSRPLFSEFSGNDTPPVNSPAPPSQPLPSVGVTSSTPPQLFWVVHSGKVPGLYFSEETTIAMAGVAHSRVTVYESFIEASLAYTASLRAHEIVTVIDD